MDIWFKAKVDWGEALGLLSDTEAGRFAKALWKYAATGEAASLAGREQMLFALVLADLRRRDAADSSRATAPLRAADDAVRIDSTSHYIEEVIEQICSLAREAR